MVFNIDFTGLSALPAGFTCTQPVTFDADGVTIPAGAELRYTDPSGNASLATDIRLTGKRADGTTDMTLYIIMLNNTAKHLNIAYKAARYAKITAYEGNGEGSTTAKSIISGTSTLNWSDGGASGGQEVDLRAVFDGDNLKTYANLSSIAPVLHHDHTFGAGLAPVTASDEMKIIVASTAFKIKTLESFQYVESISQDTVSLGDSVTLTGNFPATQTASEVVTLEREGVVVDITSSVTSWSANAITVTINPTQFPYGSCDIKVVDGSGGSGKASMTLNPVAGKGYIDVVDPIVDQAGILSLFDSSTGTVIDTGSQVEYDIITDLVIRPDGTYSYTGALNSLGINYRVFSMTSDDWSNSVTKTVTINRLTLTNVSNDSIVVGTSDATLTFDTNVGSGNIYYVLSKSPVRPTNAQMEAGVDSDGVAGVRAGTITVSQTTGLQVNVTNLQQGSYTLYALQKDVAGAYSSILWETFYVTGIPVVPVISAQPTSGTIQESRSTSVHTFLVAATPLTSIQWQRKNSGGSWEDIIGENTTSLYVTGTDTGNTLANSPVTIRALLEGEGLATTYTNEVTLTINEAPFMEINVPNLRDGVVRVVLLDTNGRTKFVDEDITVTNGIAKVYVNLGSGQGYIGQLYYTDGQGRKVGTGLEGVTQ
jgi:hypothetical protein